MIVKSSINYWLTSANHSSVEAEGMYLPSGLELEIEDELGMYLLTLEGIAEVKTDEEISNEQPLISGDK